MLVAWLVTKEYRPIIGFTLEHFAAGQAGTDLFGRAGDMPANQSHGNDPDETGRLSNRSHLSGDPDAQDATSEVKRVLTAIECGDPDAAHELLPLVYDQLRAIARQGMAQEHAGHSLQATALAHEAYLRLVGRQDIGWTNRAHFFAAAAEAIRRLEEEDGQAARVVHLRFFSGLSVDDTARSLGLSPRTVARDWSYARAWLHDALRSEEP